MTNPAAIQPVDESLLAILRCPVTGARLRPGAMPDGGPALISEHPERPLAYPVRSGVPILLAHESVALN
ncbi:Trm112 family protein [Ruania alba]|uniref:Uncharacterized protein n=1 Tax=Ruania alba TaxID=648782 RepID=A0A1H5NAC7_9MICO|nr:hypothetical protein [Ruania alba]SEE98506.1 hypothetical protein SAMN04488554_4120 [Ruania alba]